MAKNNVIFTTPAKSITDIPTTPTGVWAEHIDEAAFCCNIYIKNHNSIDFMLWVGYNKA